MSRKFFFIILISLGSITSFYQGLNNAFDYDEKDLGILFSELGFATFKFPIKQDTNHVYDFVIEEFRDGKLISK